MTRKAVLPRAGSISTVRHLDELVEVCKSVKPLPTEVVSLYPDQEANFRREPLAVMNGVECVPVNCVRASEETPATVGNLLTFILGAR